MLPQQHGLTCDAPQPRRMRWLRWYPYSRQCIVADWQEAAIQHVHVSAMLSCASLAMVLSLNSGLRGEQHRQMHRLCLVVEQGAILTDAEAQEYNAALNRTDSVISKGLRVVLGTVLVLGLASGLAGLRTAALGNTRPVLLQSSRLTLQPEDFTEVFRWHLADEGLAIRDDDYAMYANVDLTRRDEILQRLEENKEATRLKTRETFLDGSKALTAFTMDVWAQGLDMVLLFMGAYAAGFAIKLVWNAWTTHVWYVAAAHWQLMGYTVLQQVALHTLMTLFTITGMFTIGLGIMAGLGALLSWVVGGGGSPTATLGPPTCQDYCIARDPNCTLWAECRRCEHCWNATGASF